MPFESRTTASSVLSHGGQRIFCVDALYSTEVLTACRVNNCHCAMCLLELGAVPRSSKSSGWRTLTCSCPQDNCKMEVLVTECDECVVGRLTARALGLPRKRSCTACSIAIRPRPHYRHDRGRMQQFEVLTATFAPARTARRPNQPQTNLHSKKKKRNFPSR